MTKNITVYTVILNDYDNLRPPKVIEPGVRYVCVTDEPFRCDPWEIYPAWMPLESQVRNSRIPKILPHLFFNSEYTIYHDGCYRLTAKPSALINECLCDADIAFFKHPCRNSIVKELELCKREGIGYGPEMEAQVDRYRSAGIGDGLWAGTFIARRNIAEVKKFNESWWMEFLNGCLRDQFALVGAQHATGIKIHTINDHIMQNHRMEFCWHAAFKNNKDDPKVTEERNQRIAWRERVKVLCNLK